MKKNVIEINSDQLENMVEFAEEKEIEIKAASLKDQLCSYTYQLLHGLTKGDELGRKGAHIVHDDMLEAFNLFNVFFAHIDGVFHWANNQTHISELENNEDMGKFYVSAFKITGSDESKSLILTGTKDTNLGSVTYSTPKIKLTEGSSYLYVEELRERLRVVIEQVEAYMNGKTAPQYEQLSMDFEAASEANDDDFNKAKLD